LEHNVYQSLEDSGGIDDSKQHDLALIMSTGYVKGCLPLISFAYLNQVVGIPKVQFVKHGGHLERFESRGEEW
jgi:hypothetical protein